MRRGSAMTRGPGWRAARALVAATAVLCAGCATNQPAAPHTPTSQTTPYTPVDYDWQVSVKVIEQQCFDTAGCHVTVSVTPSYVGSQPLPATGRIEVTYELAGGSDGTITRTISVEHG